MHAEEEQRSPQAILGITRRARLLFAATFVARRRCTASTISSSRLGGDKNDLAPDTPQFVQQSLGYSNPYDWLEKEYGYSRGSAHRRIQTARLLEEVPEARAKLGEGSLNLTALAQVQSAVRKAEWECGKPLDLRRELVEKVEGKSYQEAERILAAEFPNQKPKESMRAVNAEKAKLTLILGEEAVENLKRVRELISHATPNATYADVVAFLAKEFVSRKAPEKKPARPYSNRPSELPSARQMGTILPGGEKRPPGGGQGDQVNPTDLSTANAGRIKSPKKIALLRARGKCEFRNPDSGKICGSRYQVEIDHIIPRALGGTDALENLRCLCKQHNLFEAERKLGKEFMSQFRMRP